MSILKDMFYRNSWISDTFIDYDIYVPSDDMEYWIRLYQCINCYDGAFTEDNLSDVIVHNCIKYACEQIVSDIKNVRKELIFINRSKYVNLCENLLTWYNYYNCTNNMPIVIVNFIHNSCLRFRVQTILGNVKVSITYEISPTFKYPGNKIDNFELAMLIRHKFKERFIDGIVDIIIPLVIKYEENKICKERQEEKRRQALKEKKLEEERIRKEKKEKL